MKIARIIPVVFFVFILSISSAAYATPPYGSGYGSGNEFAASATISSIFGQSTSPTGGESNVNVIQLSTSLESACTNSRLYILPEDKEQFAIALSAKASGSTVNVWYTTDAPSMEAYGVANPTTCKLIFIYY